MKSSIDVLKELFRYLDVAEVREKLKGRIYINGVPDTSQDEDIDIRTLTNGNGYLQSGFINLNLYLPQTKGGRPNLEKFEELMNIIIPLVENLVGKDYYFQINDDKGIFKDQDRDGMYFYNLKLDFQTI